VAVLGGARLTNEAAYAWAKLAKGVLGTDNVDAQLGDGLPAEVTLGLPRATIDDACRPGGAVLLVGPDPKEELPVLFLRLRHAVLEDDVAVVELSPTGTGTSALARASLRHRPGEVVPLVRALLGRGTADRRVAGVEPDAVREAAELLADRPVTVILGRTNLAESSAALAMAATTIHDAHPDVRFLSGLRRANVHGALDLGLAPGLLPGRVTLDGARDWFATRWPTLPQSRGLDAAGILRAAADGKIDTLVLLGADPLADFPDRDLAERGLAGARTVIACDQFLTESVKQADVVLPVAGYAEVVGTTTNLEGRVSLLDQKVTPPGTAQPDWVIAADLADRLGHDLGLISPEQIWKEIEAVAPAFAGVTLDLLRSPHGRDGVVVPRPPAVTPVALSGLADPDLRVDTDAGDASEGDASEGDAGGAGDAESGAGDGAADAAGAGEVPAAEAVDVSQPPPVGVPLPDRPVIDPPTLDAYSLRLIVTRKLYDRGTLVRHAPSLADLTERAGLRLHPHDFDRLGVAAGDDVRVTSSRGHVTVPARPDPTVPRGCAGLYANATGGRASVLVDAAAQVTDVRVERP
jgi:NADH-quinone oxidoreductase subunit G